MSVFRGLVRTSGFVLDIPLLGRDEGIARVMSWWRDGAELSALPDGRWLLQLPSPVEVRAEQAPGLPVTDAAESGVAAFPDHGELVRYRVNELARVPVGAWLDVSGIQIGELDPLDGPEPVAERLGQPEIVAPPDLRAVAGIGRRTSRSGRTPRIPRVIRWRRIVLPAWVPAIAVVMIAVSLILAVAGSRHHATSATGPAPTASPSTASNPAPAPDPRGSAFPGLALIPVAVAIGMSLFARRGRPPRQGGRAAGVHGGRPQANRGWLAWLAMRSPAAPIVRGKHARYLRALTEAFEKRQWDDALRDAIALNDRSASKWMRLRLPGRRTGALTPTPARGGGGGAVPWGPVVYAHLQDLYQDAATRLERDGRIEEAAFVLADLLGRPLDSVALLENHQRLRLAAELAEGRRLPPDLVVRLWWREGNRDRAIQIARVRGAFATGIARLDAVDPDAARELRVAWIGSCRDSGDPLGAVEAAWPDTSLRHLIADDIREGIAIGGPLSARLTAYDLAIAPARARMTVKALLEDGDPMFRELFATTLADVDAADPATDRQITTATLRALTRDSAQPGTLPVKSARKTYEKLRKRADPLAAADLPALAYQHAKAQSGPLDLVASQAAGQLPVFDAAALPDGTILIASGEAGTRVLSSQGRTRARWDIPAHRIVLADHGGTALLIAARDTIADLWKLDLTSRRLRRWTTIHVRQVADSYDGGQLIVVDTDGIAVLDVLAGRPTVLWRELDPAYRVLSLARTPTTCSAVVYHETKVSLWHWNMPGWQLRMRPSTTSQSTATITNAPGYLLALEPDPETGGPRLSAGKPGNPPCLKALSPEHEYRLLASGQAHALASSDGITTTLEIGLGMSADPQIRATFSSTGPDSIGLREHAGTLTLWQRDGRILVTTANELQASLRTTA